MAPKRFAAGFRAHRFYKLSSFLALLLANFLIVGLAAFCHLSAYFIVQEKLSSTQLYDHIWTGVKDNLYSQDKLKDWQHWRHKFDRQIHNDREALEFAQTMVGSLNDPYTFLLDAQQTRQSIRQAIGQSTGVSPAPTVTWKKLPGNIGYIRIYTFMRVGTHRKLQRALIDLADCDALVIDLRGNLGGFIHESILSASLFLEAGIVWNGEFRSPGEPWNVHLQTELTPNVLWLNIARALPVPLPRQKNLANSKAVALLVDGYTASASEIFAAALKTRKHTVLIGTRTFGKGVAQTYVPVGNGVTLRITNARCYTPDNRWLGDGFYNTNGITPDLDIQPSYRNLLADPVLEAALAKLKEMTSP